MNAATRRYLTTLAAEAARDYPANVAPALRQGARRFRARVASLYFIFCIASIVLIGAVLATHPAVGALLAPPHLVGITLTPSSLVLLPGDEGRIVAVGTYSDESTRRLGASVTWTTTGSAIAEVDAGGLVTAGSPGTAVITAADGVTQASATVTVTAAALTRISVTPGDLTLEPQQEGQLSAQGTYDDGTILSVTASVDWTSSDPAIAEVDAAGKVSARGPGMATITATQGDEQGEASVTVTAPVILTGISILPDSAVLDRGASEQFTIVGDYSDGSSQPLPDAPAWASSNDKFAQVDENGLVTAVGDDGSARITATFGQFTDTATVTVAPKLIRMFIEPASVQLPLGSTAQFTAYGTYSDGSTQALSSAQWASSDPDVASVSAEGLVTSEAPGTAEIKAAQAELGATADVVVDPVDDAPVK